MEIGSAVTRATMSRKVRFLVSPPVFVGVAQTVEPRFCKPQVGGASPSRRHRMMFFAPMVEWQTRRSQKPVPSGVKVQVLLGAPVTSRSISAGEITGLSTRSGGFDPRTRHQSTTQRAGATDQIPARLPFRLTAGPGALIPEIEVRILGGEPLDILSSRTENTHKH